MNFLIYCFSGMEKLQLDYKLKRTIYPTTVNYKLEKVHY